MSVATLDGLRSAAEAEPELIWRIAPVSRSLITSCMSATSSRVTSLPQLAALAALAALVARLLPRVLAVPLSLHLLLLLPPPLPPPQASTLAAALVLVLPLLLSPPTSATAELIAASWDASVL